MQDFILFPNNVLKIKTKGFYHQPYTGFGSDDNPDFINVIKNNFNNKPSEKLQQAKNEVEQILLQDIPDIIGHSSLKYVLVSVPRSRAEKKLFPNQTLFRQAVSDAAQKISGAEDGAETFIRHTSVRTTHIRKEDITFQCADGSEVNNDDCKSPYAGITKDTCKINTDMIKNKNIILIDDVYTRTVNIDEDCIQALYDNGAASVIFYAIGYTQRG